MRRVPMSRRGVPDSPAAARRDVRLSAKRARPGDRIEIRGSKGGFHLRDVFATVLLIAGGTGLSAILAIAEQLVLEPARVRSS